MSSRRIKIRIALNSIIYLPVYIFCQMYNRNTKFKTGNGHIVNFREHVGERALITKEYFFDIFANVDMSTLQAQFNADFPPSLIPIQYDPVLSPVVDSSTYRGNDGYNNDLIAIADPLRLVRLKKALTTINGDFLGTLINKKAFWIVTLAKCVIDRESASKFNLVGCHPVGMTGYYIAELIFKHNNNNPLAPCDQAGNEIEYLKDILAAEEKRKKIHFIEDPVWIASLTTEFGNATILQKRKNRSYSIKIVKPQDELPTNFIMTSIIKRTDDPDIAEISKVIEFGLREAIRLINQNDAAEILHSTFVEMCELLQKSKHANNNVQNIFIEDIDVFKTVIEELKSYYPEKLITLEVDRHGTDKLIDSILAHEKKRNKQRNARWTKNIAQLKTQNWEAEGTLWQK